MQRLEIAGIDSKQQRYCLGKAGQLRGMLVIGVLLYPTPYWLVISSVSFFLSKPFYYYRLIA